MSDAQLRRHPPGILQVAATAAPVLAPGQLQPLHQRHPGHLVPGLQQEGGGDAGVHPAGEGDEDLHHRPPGPAATENMKRSKTGIAGDCGSGWRQDGRPLRGGSAYPPDGSSAGPAATCSRKAVRAAS